MVSRMPHGNVEYSRRYVPGLVEQGLSGSNRAPLATKVICLRSPLQATDFGVET
jgi:hypothetical protein